MLDAELQKRIKRIQRRALACARSQGFEQDADDFAQVAAMRLLKNPNRAVGNVFIDYIRETYGRHRYKISKNKNNIVRHYAELTEDNCGISNMKQDFDFTTYQNQLKDRERAYMTLRFKWNFTENEIGEVFGVSESRVSQVLTEAKKKIEKFIMKEQIRAG